MRVEEDVKEANSVTEALVAGNPVDEDPAFPEPQTLDLYVRVFPGQLKHLPDPVVLNRREPGPAEAAQTDIREVNCPDHLSSVLGIGVYAQTQYHTQGHQAGEYICQ